MSGWKGARGVNNVMEPALWRCDSTRVGGGQRDTLKGPL